MVGKFLYDKRWSLFWWFAVLLGLTFLTVLFFPSLKNTFGKAMEEVPNSMKSLIGSAADYQTIEGYLNVQIFNQMTTMLIIYAVIIGSGLIAGDEGEGTLQTLLAQPISRSRVFFNKLLSLIIMNFVVSSSLLFGSIFGSLAVQDMANLVKLVAAYLVISIFVSMFAIIAYCLGAATGKRVLSASFVGAYAFVSYVINTLASSVSSLKYVNYLSLFRNFNSPSPLKTGLNITNLVIYVVISGFAILLGWYFFRKRDLPLR